MLAACMKKRAYPEKDATLVYSSRLRLRLELQCKLRTLVNHPPRVSEVPKLMDGTQNQPNQSRGIDWITSQWDEKLTCPRTTKSRRIGPPAATSQERLIQRCCGVRDWRRIDCVFSCKGFDRTTRLTTKEMNKRGKSGTHGNVGRVSSDCESKHEQTETMAFRFRVFHELWNSRRD